MGPPSSGSHSLTLFCDCDDLHAVLVPPQHYCGYRVVAMSTSKFRWNHHKRRGLPLHCVILPERASLRDQLTSAVRFTKTSRYGWAVTFRQDTFMLPFRGSQKKDCLQDLILINSWVSFARIRKRDLNDISVLGAHSVQFNPTPDHAAVCAAPYIAMATGLLVCMKTVPGPTNLHTRPSLAAKLLIMPPDAIRSSVYLQFHATRWPLSMMYFSPSRS